MKNISVLLDEIPDDDYFDDVDDLVVKNKRLFSLDDFMRMEMDLYHISTESGNGETAA